MMCLPFSPLSPVLRLSICNCPLTCISSLRQIGRLGMLGALSLLALVALLVQPAGANNEIVNFGPTLCRADEVGHLEDKAARQVSQEW